MPIHNLRKRFNIINIRYGLLKGLFCVFVIASTGCLSIQGPDAVGLEESEIVSKVRFSTRAVVMTVGDSQSLSISALAVNGNPISVKNEDIKWRSLDSAVVRITQNGMLHAATATSNPVGVIATYYYNLVSKADTVYVTVTESSLSASEVKIVALDSTFVGAGGLYFIPNPRIRVDLFNNGSVIVKGAEIPLTVAPPVKVDYRSTGGPDFEPVYEVSNENGKVGDFWIVASVLLYGQEVKDSVKFTGTHPYALYPLVISADEGGKLLVENQLPLGFAPSLSPCGWFMILLAAVDKPIDILFSDSLSGSSGCGELPADAGYYGIPFDQSPTGGNLLNMILTSDNIYGIATYMRRSNIRGEITYRIRDRVTKELHPFVGKYKQVDPN